MRIKLKAFLLIIGLCVLLLAASCFQVEARGNCQGGKRGGKSFSGGGRQAARGLKRRLGGRAAMRSSGINRKRLRRLGMKEGDRGSACTTAGRSHAAVENDETHWVGHDKSVKERTESVSQNETISRTRQKRANAGFRRGKPARNKTGKGILASDEYFQKGSQEKRPDLNPQGLMEEEGIYYNKQTPKLPER